MLKQAESYHLLLKQCRRKQANIPSPISATLPVPKEELNLVPALRKKDQLIAQILTSLNTTNGHMKSSTSRTREAITRL